MKNILIFTAALLFFVGCIKQAHVEELKIKNPYEKRIDLGVKPKKGLSFEFGNEESCSVEGYSARTDQLTIAIWSITSTKIHVQIIKLERHEPYVHAKVLGDGNELCSEFIWTLEEDHMILYVSSIKKKDCVI